ncbi:response regulator [Ectothiorhodospiraceae bacterium BW-2]|nr:response regulator [Ectothiorhodospiraceae bacterium BW-2]
MSPLASESITAAEQEHYCQILQQFLAEGSETALMEATELGRAMVARGVPPEEAIELHQLALEQQVLRARGGVAELIESSTALLYEMIMAYGIAFRAHIELLQRRQRANLESITEQSDEMVVLTDRAGRVEYVNRAFSDITGYRRSAARQMALVELLGLEVGERQLLQRSIESAERFSRRLQHVDAKGQPYVTDTVFFPLRDHQLQLSNFVLVGRDITHKVAMERDLQQKSQRLEAIGTLAAGISHDFNNVLGMILGYASLLNASLRQQEDRDNLAQIRAAAERGRELVEQILAFSRPGRERVRKAIPLAKIVRETLSLLRGSYPHRIAFEIDANDDSLTVWAVSTHLTQLVMNLAVNALQAMQLEGGQLTVSVARQGESVMLKVADSGPGIAAEIRERIFDPFFTTKEEGEGTGLGLSVVSDIIRRYRGSVDIDSQLGRGTTFTLLFPLCGSEGGAMAAIEPPPVIADPPRVASERQATPAHLVVVDDELSMLQLAGEVLQGAGYRVTLESSAWSALRTLYAEEAALLITDREMPELDGVELVRRVHGLKPELPLLMWTGHPDEASEQAAREYGVAEILYKPVDFDRLKAVIETITRELN